MPKYKVIFVDFDDTLCVHTEYLNDKYKQFLFCDPETLCEKIYRSSLVNHILLTKLTQLKNEYNAQVILISSANSLLLDAKKHWCMQHCPDLFNQFISSSIELTKADIILSYCTHEHLNEREVLFVDDSWREREQALHMNIHAVTPQEIMLS